MKPRCDVSPYTASKDMDVNASLSLGKLYKRIRSINPACKPSSHYRTRFLNRQATRKMKPGIVR